MNKHSVQTGVYRDIGYPGAGFGRVYPTGPSHGVASQVQTMDQLGDPDHTGIAGGGMVLTVFSALIGLLLACLVFATGGSLVTSVLVYVAGTPFILALACLLYLRRN